MAFLGLAGAMILGASIARAEDNGQGGTAQIGVVWSANSTSVTVTSTKDLSNIVLGFCDGSTQKFDGLTGLTGTFSGTGDHEGDVIATVWVKSGDNASGDGPGFGERFNNPGARVCAAGTPSPTPTITPRPSITPTLVQSIPPKVIVRDVTTTKPRLEVQGKRVKLAHTGLDSRMLAGLVLLAMLLIVSGLLMAKTKPPAEMQVQAERPAPRRRWAVQALSRISWRQRLARVILPRVSWQPPPRHLQSSP